MIKTKRRKLAVAALIAALLLLAGYGYLQARQFLSGPKLAIHSPENGALLDAAAVTIAGEAHNIARITLNDSPIFVDKEGFFSEKLLLHPGYNIMSVKVEDKFGRSIEKKLELVRRRAEPTSSPAPDTADTHLFDEARSQAPSTATTTSATTTDD